MSLYYIGAFPPGWGGVTIKNLVLFNAISDEGVRIKKIDLHRITRQRKITELLRLAFAVLGRKNYFVIGISTKMRKAFTNVLYLLNRNAMRRSVLIVMGGTASRDLIRDPVYMAKVSEFKKVYVETVGMLETLRSKGMSNVALYPNCRKRPSSVQVDKVKKTILSCVFFSYIQPQKGVDVILETAMKMPDVKFEFYGVPDPVYAEQFYEIIKTLHNCSYHGGFKGGDEDVYSELKQYDVLLFPTKWETEGVPGILVEAKIAGLPCIVSDKSYNHELVKNGEEGIVLVNNDVESLTEAIRTLDQDRVLLQSLSEGSYKSSERFYIDRYVGGIIEELK